MIVCRIHHCKSPICLDFVYSNTLSNETKRTIDQSTEGDSFIHTLTIFFFLSTAITANPRLSDESIFFETFCKAFNDSIALKTYILLYA